MNGLYFLILKFVLGTSVYSGFFKPKRHLDQFYLKKQYAISTLTTNEVYRINFGFSSICKLEKGSIVSDGVKLKN